jgi:hypothetical protein
MTGGEGADLLPLSNLPEGLPEGPGSGCQADLTDEELRAEAERFAEDVARDLHGYL